MSTERARTNVLLRSEQSGEQLAVMDNVVPAGFPGPPLHHHHFDETFYVLEGELTFQLEDELFTRKRGELAFAPRDIPHTFANLSGADARTLIICTPGGFERYFDRLAAKQAGIEPPPDALKPWPEVTMVGPRIGERDHEAEPAMIGGARRSACGQVHDAGHLAHTTRFRTHGAATKDRSKDHD